MEDQEKALQCCSLGSFVNPSIYWMTPKTRDKALDQIECILSQEMKLQPSSAAIITNLFLDQYVAVEDPENKSLWCRGQVKDVNSGQGIYEVFLIDYGYSVEVDKSKIRCISDDVRQNPEPAAFNLHLYKIVPREGHSQPRISNEWSEEAKQFVLRKLDQCSEYFVQPEKIVGRIVYGDLYLRSKGEEPRSMKQMLCAKEYAALLSEAAFLRRLENVNKTLSAAHRKKDVQEWLDNNELKPASSFVKTNDSPSPREQVATTTSTSSSSSFRQRVLRFRQAPQEKSATSSECCVQTPRAEDKSSEKVESENVISTSAKPHEKILHLLRQSSKVVESNEVEVNDIVVDGPQEPERSGFELLQDGVEPEVCLEPSMPLREEDVGDGSFFAKFRREKGVEASSSKLDCRPAGKQIQVDKKPRSDQSTRSEPRPLTGSFHTREHPNTTRHSSGSADLSSWSRFTLQNSPKSSRHSVGSVESHGSQKSSPHSSVSGGYQNFPKNNRNSGGSAGNDNFPKTSHDSPGSKRDRHSPRSAYRQHQNRHSRPNNGGSSNSSGAQSVDGLPSPSRNRNFQPESVSSSKSRDHSKDSSKNNNRNVFRNVRRHPPDGRELSADRGWSDSIEYRESKAEKENKCSNANTRLSSNLPQERNNEPKRKSSCHSTSEFKTDKMMPHPAERKTDQLKLLSCRDVESKTDSSKAGNVKKKRNILELMMNPTTRSEPEFVECVSVQEDFYLSRPTGYHREPSSKTDSFCRPYILRYESDLMPLNSVTELKADANIVKNLIDMNYKDFSYIQRWAIPSIQRGVNTVMISGFKTGKTMSCIIPLLEFMQDESLFDEVPEGNGPLAVILCSSSRTAQWIFDMCHNVLGNRTERQRQYSKIKILITHGGGREEEMWVNLTNGCSILISTPHCLARLLDMPIVTNLERLSYLVLDEADVLTSRPFSDPLKVIMEKAAFARDKRCVQMIVAAETWSPDLASFVKLFEQNHVAIFGSQLEAAVFARLKPVLLYVDKERKAEVLLDKISADIGRQRIVIICSNVTEISFLKEALKTKGAMPLIAHENVMHEDLLNVSRDWSLAQASAYPILLCTDDVLHELRSIGNAHVLVHYSLPYKHKATFGLRFSCFLENYADPSLPLRVGEKTNAERLKVLVMIDDENHIQLPHITEFARRLGAVIHSKVTATCAKIERHIELEKENVPLCSSVLEFGQCLQKRSPVNYGKKCSRRHAMIKDVDSPKGILLSGQVKFKIVEVHNACSFAVKLLEHVTPDGKVTVLTHPDDIDMAEELAKHYEPEENRMTHGMPAVGDICAVQDEEGKFHRGRVIDFTKLDEHGQPLEVEVRRLEKGDVLQMKRIALYELPERLAKHPPGVVQVFACGILPVDYDIHWSKPATCYVHNLAQKVNDGEYWIGRIVLSLDGALWLDPIRLGRFLEITNVHVTSFSLRDQLLKKNLVVENENHLKLLQKLCRDADIPVPKYESAKKNQREPSVEPRQAHFQEQFSRVVFSSANSTTSIFLRQAKFKAQLIDLAKDCEYEAMKLKKKGRAPSLEVGMYCLAYDEYDGWNRGKIESEAGENYEVNFVDYGDIQTISKRNVMPVSNRILEKLPVQAIECSLVGLQAPDESFSEVNDKIYDFSENGAEELYARIIHKDVNADGKFKYRINLVNLKGQSLNKQLVEKKLVQPLQEEMEYLIDVGIPETNDDDEAESEEENWELKPKEEFMLENFQGSSLVDPLFSTEPEPKTVNATTDKLAPIDLDDPEYGVKMLERGDYDIVGFFEDRDETPLQQAKESPTKRSSNTNRTLPALSPSKPEPVVEPKPKEEETNSNSKSQYLLQLFNKRQKMKKMQMKNNKETGREDCVKENQKIEQEKRKNSISGNVPRSERTEGTLTPNVLWSQTTDTVKIKIMLTDVKDYHLQCSPNRLLFRSKLNEKYYVVNLRLFGSVCPRLTKVQCKTFFVEVVLKKLASSEFPRLHEDDKKHHWIKIDPDAAAEEEEEDLITALYKLPKSDVPIKRRKVKIHETDPEACYESDDCCSNDSFEDQSEDPYDPLAN